MPAIQATPARDSFVFLLLMASVFVVPMSLAFMGRMAPAAPVQLACAICSSEGV